MADLTELQRLAEGATPCDGWYVLKHGHGSDVRGRHVTGGSTWVAECRTDAEAAYIAAMSPDTAKKLIAVALLADAMVNPPQMATGYHQRKQREADEEALRTALEELK